MNITIISVGKLKEKYLKQGIEEYLKRLSAYVRINILELSDEKAPENLSQLQMQQIKQKEGNRILEKIHPDAYVIALAVEGQMQSSEQFATKLGQLSASGKNSLVFVIGGSLGLSDDVMKRSNEAISFSKMTFPHQLMRLILVEQVYRGFRILRGEPYHK